MKVILETGELGDATLIGVASRLVIEHGANFIKTSTGKTEDQRDSFGDGGDAARDQRSQSARRAEAERRHPYPCRRAGIPGPGGRCDGRRLGIGTHVPVRGERLAVSAGRHDRRQRQSQTLAGQKETTDECAATRDHSQKARRPDPRRGRDRGLRAGHDRRFGQRGPESARSRWPCTSAACPPTNESRSRGR